VDRYSRHALARGPERGLLKHGCYFKPHDDGADSAVFFGGFYVARALGRLLVPDAFGPTPAALAS
jgi:unsaturated chondroitin disaccharide hydrolase